MNTLHTAIVSRSLCLVLALCVGLVLPGGALATAVDVNVVSDDGRPLQYAAVMAGWEGAPPPQPSAKPAVMSQHDMTFVPHMLIVPQGEHVMFPNRDRTQHHVYSFSKTKVFDIKLYIGRPERPITFNKPGVVTLGCNIHDYMQAFIMVSDKPRWAITDAAGNATLAKLPDAPVKLSIWHPWMPSEQARVERMVAPGIRQVTVSLDVDPPPQPPQSDGPSLQDKFDSLAN